MRDKRKFAEKIVALAPLWSGNPNYWKYFIYKGNTYVFNFVQVESGFVCKPAFETSYNTFKQTPEEAITEELKDVWK